jgi:exodeoxyribonuclease VII large subunit
MPPSLFESQILTPSLVAERIADDFARLGQIRVEGEIAGLVRANSGHTYFQLKDERAVLKAVIWRGQLPRSGAASADNGMMVQARGTLSVYPPRGEYQMIVASLAPKGEGALRQAYERLKLALEAEGLFEDGRKRPVPLPPRRVAVVTSPESAAATDFLTTATRITADVSLSVMPVRVQGPGSAAEMAAALEALNNHGGFDLIVVTRGGGSLEDLWAFNEEVLVRAVAASRIPVLAAIGHSTDLSLVEMAADLRAITPTAAAEAVFVSDEARLESLGALRSRLILAARASLAARRAELAAAATRLNRLTLRLMTAAQTLDNLGLRLRLAARARLDQARSRLGEYARILELKSPRAELARRRSELDQLASRLPAAAAGLAAGKRSELARLQTLLAAVSPLKILERGYAVATDEAGRILRSASEAPPGSRVGLRLAQGRLEAVVTGGGGDRP